MSSGSLQGKHILLTRAAHQLAELDAMLRARGAIPVHFPCLATEPLNASLEAGLRLADQASDLLFTSVNGVEAVDAYLTQQGDSLAQLCNDKRVAAVGTTTARALKSAGVEAAIVPENASQEGLLAAYEANGLPESLLFFRAEQGNDLLADALQQAGVTVHTIHAYRTICPTGSDPEVVNQLESGAIDAVLLGSSRTAQHYVERVGSAKIAATPVIAVISEQVADAARKSGLQVQVVAKEASFAAMLDALEGYFACPTDSPEE